MNEQTTWSPTLTRVTPVAHRVDHSGALVPADDGHAHRRVALLDVVVGVAQPGGVELDPHLVGLGLVELELGDLPRSTGLPADRRAGGPSHVVPLRCGVKWLPTCLSGGDAGDARESSSTVSRAPFPGQTAFTARKESAKCAPRAVDCA